MEISKIKQKYAATTNLRHNLKPGYRNNFSVKSGQSMIDSDFIVEKISPDGNIVLYDVIKKRKYSTQAKSIWANEDCNEEKSDKPVIVQIKSNKSESLIDVSAKIYDPNDYENELETLIKANIKNIWLVGPAGCGKTTMSKNVSAKLGMDCLVISCGLGTGPSDFVGYKYPTREETRFSKFFQSKSLIVLDEFTALDPAVAQIANAALANGTLETTTGIINRHEDCIIVATSNTFGNGADRVYVANNQIDGATIDRFVGGIIEMDYSIDYESHFNADVVNYVWQLRDVIKEGDLRRIASTRMIIEGSKLIENNINNWKERLICNWTKEEKQLINDFARR